MSRALAAVGSVVGIIGGAALGRFAVKTLHGGRNSQGQGTGIGAFVGAALGAAIGAGTEITQSPVGVSGPVEHSLLARFP